MGPEDDGSISAVPPGQPAAKPSVLHIEDNATVQEVIRRILKDVYQVVTVSSLREAIEAMRLRVFDVLLLDGEFIGGFAPDAVEASRRLQTEQGRPKRTPEVVLTAGFYQESGEKAQARLLALDPPVDAILRKPIDSNKLKNCLAAVLKGEPFESDSL